MKTKTATMEQGRIAPSAQRVTSLLHDTPSSATGLRALVPALGASPQTDIDVSEAPLDHRWALRGLLGSVLFALRFIFAMLLLEQWLVGWSGPTNWINSIPIGVLTLGVVLLGCLDWTASCLVSWRDDESDLDAGVMPGRSLSRLVRITAILPLAALVGAVFASFTEIDASMYCAVAIAPLAAVHWLGAARIMQQCAGRVVLSPFVRSLWIPGTLVAVWFATVIIEESLPLWVGHAESWTLHTAGERILVAGGWVLRGVWLAFCLGMGGWFAIYAISLSRAGIPLCLDIKDEDAW